MNLRLKESERRLEDTQRFLFQKFGKRTEIQGAFEAEKAEMTVSVGKRRKEKLSFLLTLRRLLGKLVPLEQRKDKARLLESITERACP